jgi:glycosyltransferase involved in cell wall biosynthesis
MRAHEKIPLVSIGLPVFNGGRYLAEAIESILSQTYRHFELILCDNASTDDTEQICRRFAARDNRIRYFRNAANVGLARNFNLAAERASGKYFRWAACDDRIAPRYLARCVEALEADSTMVLCHTQVKVIDENGEEVAHFDYASGYGASPSPSARFGDALRQDRWNFEIFGLIRRNALRRTKLMGAYVASDRVLRSELSLLGRYHIVPEALFFDRDHPRRSIRAYPAHHLRAALFDPTLAGRKVFPHWRVFREYFRTVNRAPVSVWQRACCYPHIVRWLATDLNCARLVADVVIAVFPNSWHWMARVGRRLGRSQQMTHTPSPAHADVATNSAATRSLLNPDEAR